MPSLNELKAFEAAAHNGWWPRLALLARLMLRFVPVSQAVLGSGCIAIRSALFGPPCFRAECGYTGTDFRKIEIRVARSLKRAGSIRAQKRLPDPMYQDCTGQASRVATFMPAR